MKKLLFVLSLLTGGLKGFSQCSATAATNGASFGNDASIGTLAWSNAGDAVLADNNYATAGQLIALFSSVQTQYITAQNFGFSIPSGAAICGIEVEVQRHAGGLIIGSSIKDNSVKIIKNGSITGGEQSAAASWPGADAYATFGGAANQWGTAWTPADINAPGFGVAISAKLSVAAAVFLTAYVDHIRITVYYDFLLSPPPLYFRADAQAGGMKLEWATQSTKTSASQTKYFIIEKSPDTHNWRQIDSVRAGEEQSIYQSFDPAPGSINYYRLQHAGANDKLIPDYTIAAKYASKQINGVTVHPDAAARRAVIQCEEPIRSVQLFDINMRPLPSARCSNSDTKAVVNMNGLAPGMYIAKLVTRTHRIYTAKWMVW